MFKQITAVFLFLALLASTSRGLVIVSGYYANQAAFARFCENKAKPILKCNGKCQLAKKLQEGDQTPSREINALPWFDTISSRSFFGELQCPAAILVAAFTGRVTDGTPVDFARSIFHPPAMV